MGRVPIVLGMLLLVAGGGAVGYTLTRKVEGGMTPDMSARMDAAVKDLETSIDAARSVAHGRAKDLAIDNLVTGVIATDEPTAVDMYNGRGKELAKFQPEMTGEVIELGNVDVPAGKTPNIVLTIFKERDAPGAKTPPASPHDGKPGSYVDLVDDMIVATEVVPVTSSDAKLAAQKAGFVTVRRPINDAKGLIDDLVKSGFAGKLQVGAGSVKLGEQPAGAPVETRPLKEKEAAIVYALPPAKAEVPKAVLAAGAGGAVFGLVLVVVGMMGGKKKVAAVSSATPTQITAAQSLVTAPNGAQIAPGSSQTIGRWEVVRRLGSGGMADVYLARAKGEAGFEKLVALKVMHAHLARNERAVEHFLDEARLAANVHHPNVVAIQDLGKIGNDYAIVMEYVDGVDLERLLMSARTNSRPVPVNVGLGILRRICDGIDAAHKALAPDGTPLGIIHRDVKSANVLVSKQGGVKVVDFGIAKAATQSHLTIAGETKGTPSMMAPEQRVGELVDVRADVYSVAAVGYEILTNHGVNLDLAALAHLGVENWPHLPLPSTLRSALPRELDDLLLGAMSFERDKRPADCEAFEASIEALMKKHDLTATDKDIGRWVESEVASVEPTPARASDLANKQTG